MRRFSWVGMICLLGILTSCSTYEEHIRSRELAIGAQSHTGIYHRYFTGGYILTNPSTKTQTRLLQMIDEAREAISLEIYTLTDISIIEALQRAHDRGVRVEVILEGGVFNAPTINITAYNSLKKSGVPVKWADAEKFVFTHAKFWIIDDQSCISTGNITKTGYKKNRDHTYCSTDPSLRGVLTSVFRADWEQRWLDVERVLTDERIGLSPNTMRSWLHGWLSEADTEVLWLYQSLSDPEIVRIFRELSEKIPVILCLPAKEADEVKSLLPDAHIYGTKKPYIHTKLLLIDDDVLLLGSMNLTENSIERNREVGIALDPTLYRENLRREMQEDCQIPDLQFSRK